MIDNVFCLTFSAANGSPLSLEKGALQLVRALARSFGKYGGSTMTNERHIAPSCEMYKSNRQNSSGNFARVRAVLICWFNKRSPFSHPHPTPLETDKFFPKSVKNYNVFCAQSVVMTELRI